MTRQNESEWLNKRVRCKATGKVGTVEGAGKAHTWWKVRFFDNSFKDRPERYLEVITEEEYQAEVD